MAKMGRPSLFTDSLKQRLMQLYSAGKTDAQVARDIGINVTTLYNWKANYPDFFNALKEMKDVADGLVEASLFQRAIGYSHPEEKVFCAFGNVTRVMTRKHHPPDVTAAMFWLQNRAPERWRNVKFIQLEQQNNKPSTEENKKNFSDFCATAGYPSPFPKQIEMMGFGMSDGEPRLLLGSRGYGKTDYVTVLGVAYDIYLNGVNTTNLIISKSKVRNTAIVEEIAMALNANGVELEKQNSSCIRVKGLVGKDHSVEVLTIKSSFRGRHPKRIIMDDPVTEEDTSEAMRTLVKKKYDEAYKLCHNICIIGQPAHKFDLYADLRDKLKKLEIPVGSIPELDPDLEAMRLAGVDEKSIQASYFLKIVSEGSTPFDNLKFLDKYPKGDSVAFIDPSHEGNDYTAITIMRAHFDGVAVVGFTYKKAWNHCLNEMADKMQHYGVKRVCFETNALGDQPIIMLRQVFKGGVIGKKTVTQKHARIMNAGAYAHLIHLSKESDKTFMDQVVQYEYNAKNDDAPDSLASCLEWIGLLRGK